MAYVNNGVSEFDADAMKDFYNFPHTCNWPDHTWITVYNQKEKDFVYDRMKETKTAAEVDIRLYRSSTVAKEVLNSMLTAAPAHQGSQSAQASPKLQVTNDEIDNILKNVGNSEPLPIVDMKTTKSELKIKRR